MKLSEIAVRSQELLNIHGDMDSIIICKPLCGVASRFTLESISVEYGLQDQAVLFDLEVYVD